MTAFLVALAVVLALPFGFRSAGGPEQAPKPADPFTTTVRPVLAARCAPCHEPGGTMYSKMPFDRGETIASHPEGVLKRLKGEERAAVEKWLASLPPAH
jgi:hypothetical protein